MTTLEAHEGAFQDTLTDSEGQDTLTDSKGIGATSFTYKVKLSNSDGKKELGFLGKDKDGWAIIVKKENDATVLEQVIPQDRQHYYSTTDFDQVTTWLSVSDGEHYVGFYSDMGQRSSWVMGKGNRWVNSYSGGKMSRKKGNDHAAGVVWLYARGDLDCEVLTVELTRQK